MACGSLSRASVLCLMGLASWAPTCCRALVRHRSESGSVSDFLEAAGLLERSSEGPRSALVEQHSAKTGTVSDFLEATGLLERAGEEQTGALPAPATGPLLYIGVVSAPVNEARRMAVRDAWATQLAGQHLEDKRVLIEFLIGRAPIQGGAGQHQWGTRATSSEIALEHRLQSESNRFGDIMRLPTLDVYDELPLKVLQLLSRGVDLGYPFIMKMDDDQMLNAAGALSALAGRTSTAPLYAGRVLFEETPGVAPTLAQKGADETFKRYFDGSCYVLTSDLARLVAKGDVEHSVSYNMFGGTAEDVNMGHWVAYEDDKLAKFGLLGARRVEYMTAPFCRDMPNAPEEGAPSN